jgi:hypothetical protein
MPPSHILRHLERSVNFLMAGCVMVSDSSFELPNRFAICTHQSAAIGVEGFPAGAAFISACNMYDPAVPG